MNKEEFVTESQNVIADSKKKVKKAYDDLKLLVVSV